MLCEWGKSQAQILSCCHLQEVMLLLPVSVVSRGQKWCYTLSLSLQVSCGFRHCVSSVAEREREREKTLKIYAREMLGILVWLVEEFFLPLPRSTQLWELVAHAKWKCCSPSSWQQLWWDDSASTGHGVEHHLPHLNLHTFPGWVSERGRSQRGVRSKRSQLCVSAVCLFHLITPRAGFVSRR